jgi:hypothetical protein
VSHAKLHKGCQLSFSPSQNEGNEWLCTFLSCVDVMLLQSHIFVGLKNQFDIFLYKVLLVEWKTKQNYRPRFEIIRFSPLKSDLFWFTLKILNFFSLLVKILRYFKNLIFMRFESQKRWSAYIFSNWTNPSNSQECPTFFISEIKQNTFGGKNIIEKVLLSQT